MFTSRRINLLVSRKEYFESLDSSFGVMSEQSLIQHVVFDTVVSRYFAIGADLPSVRVFDCVSGSLACTVTKPKVTGRQLSQLVESSRLASVTFGAVEPKKPQGRATQSTVGTAATTHAVGCVIGLSDGSIVLHNVTADAPMGHQSISDTQQAIVSLRMLTGFVYCLAKNRCLYVYDVANGSKRPGSTSMPHGAAAIDAKEAEDGTVRLVVAGNVIVMYLLSPSVPSASLAVGLTKIVSFAAGASPATFVHFCPLSRCIVTCGGADSAIRVWDAAASTDASASARCRRSLACGGTSVVALQVHEGHRGAACTVVATTYDGVCRLWNFDSGLLPRTADNGPLNAVACMSVHRQTRGLKVLAGAVAPTTRKVVVACGTSALPQFISYDCDEVLAKGGTTDVEVMSLADAAGGSAEPETSAGWATHAAAALRAAATPSVVFAKATTHQDKTVKDLPRAGQAQQTLTHASSLGLASGALYQALHARDYSTVVELLSATSARSDEDMAATVELLTLPYCLQLLQVLSERATAGSVRSALNHWIAVIIRCKGNELLKLEQAMRADDAKEPSEKVQSLNISRPSVFLAPILHRFASLTAQYDRLAHAHGRLATFRSVRPLVARAAADSPVAATITRTSFNTALFGTTFKEIRSNEDVYGTAVVRLRTKVKKEKKSTEKKGVLGDESPLVDDDGELDLDAMVLDDVSDMDTKKSKGGRDRKRLRREMIVDAAEKGDDEFGEDDGDAGLFAESSDDDVESAVDADSSEQEEEAEEDDYDGYSSEAEEEPGGHDDGNEDDEEGENDDDDDDGDELQADARDPAQRVARI